MKSSFLDAARFPGGKVGVIACCVGAVVWFGLWYIVFRTILRLLLA